VYFRAPVLLGLVWTLWGVNIAVFRAYGISYGELMGFEPSTMLSPRRIILSGLGFISLVGFITLGFINEWPFSVRRGSSRRARALMHKQRRTLSSSPPCCT